MARNFPVVLAAVPARARGRRRRTSGYFPPATILRDRSSKHTPAAKSRTVLRRTFRETDHTRLRFAHAQPPAIAAKSEESRASLHWPLFPRRRFHEVGEKLRADRNSILQQR